MLRILLTGGAGFIGSHLTECLLAEGHEATVLDNLSSGKRENVPHAAKFVEADVRFDVRFPLGSFLPDFIYHLAATVGVNRVLEDPVACMENNIDSLGAVLALGIPGIFVSTSEVYGKTAGPLAEHSPVLFSSRPRWAYAASKLIGEWMALAAGWKVVRPFNVVGPRQAGHYGAVLPRFVKQALTGEPITVYGNGTQIRTFMDVRDCAEILSRLRTAAFDVVNVGGQNSLSISALAYLVQQSLLSESRVTFTPYTRAYGQGFEECQERIPELGKLRSLIGPFEYRNLYQTILDLAESLKGEAEPCLSSQTTA